MAEVIEHFIPARARVSVGVTLNLGNYQSFRIDVSHEDSQREGETVQELFARVRTVADDEAAKAKSEAEEKLNLGNK